MACMVRASCNRKCKLVELPLLIFDCYWYQNNLMNLLRKIIVVFALAIIIMAKWYVSISGRLY